MNSNSQSSSGKSLVIQRQPPAVPTSPPLTQQHAVITKPLPSLPQNAISSIADTSKHVPTICDNLSPPQPPQRTRSVKLSETTPNTKISAPNSTNKSAYSSNNQLENASNEGAKLVFKTVMMGSVQNISCMDSEKLAPRSDKRNVSSEFFIFYFEVNKIQFN